MIQPVIGISSDQYYKWSVHTLGCSTEPLYYLLWMNRRAEPTPYVHTSVLKILELVADSYRYEPNGPISKLHIRSLRYKHQLNLALAAPSGGTPESGSSSRSSKDYGSSSRRRSRHTTSNTTLMRNTVDNDSTGNYQILIFFIKKAKESNPATTLPPRTIFVVSLPTLVNATSWHGTVFNLHFFSLFFWIISNLKCLHN